MSWVGAPVLRERDSMSGCSRCRMPSIPSISLGIHDPTSQLNSCQHEHGYSQKVVYQKLRRAPGLSCSNNGKNHDSQYFDAIVKIILALRTAVVRATTLETVMEECVEFEMLHQLKALKHCFFQRFIGSRFQFPNRPFFCLDDEGLK